MRAHEFLSQTMANVATARSVAADLDDAVKEFGETLASGGSHQRLAQLRTLIQSLDRELRDMGFVYTPEQPEMIRPVTEKKDACYHKVRSRYKVWPSAYASGALVQCRKKGAKNWGTKSR